MTGALTHEKVEHTTCTVKETISRFDSIIDLVCTSVVVNLPKSEANERHWMAAAKFDIWRRHAGVGSEKRLFRKVRLRRSASSKTAGVRGATEDGRSSVSSKRQQRATRLNCSGHVLTSRRF